MKITIDMIKELREKTGCGIIDCRTALQNADGDLEQALSVLREKGLKTAAKRADRVAAEGHIEVYAHGEGRLVVIVEVNCETDFVGKSASFRELTHEIALQIAAASPEYISDADIPQEVIDEMTQSTKEQALSEGKPEAIITRILEGKIKKFKEEKVLMNQKYIRDEERTVTDIINDKISALGESIIVRRFQRWQLGETTRAAEQESEE